MYCPVSNRLGIKPVQIAHSGGHYLNSNHLPIFCLQGLRENGVEKLKPMGQEFDPNLHEALFEIPSTGQKAGTVGAVTKASFLLP